MMTEQNLIELRDLCQQQLKKLYPNVQYPLAYYNYVGNASRDCEDYKFDIWKHTNCLLLNYPSITVKNSANYVHTILDLWVIVVFSYYSDNVNTIRVTRTKLSERECNVSYIFSHAEYKKPEDFFNWRGLCFGRGYIANYVQELRCNHTYRKLRFVPLVNYLYEYFSWESLEGGPYIRMRSIIEASELRFTISNGIFNIKEYKEDQSYILASLILKHKKQDLFKGVVMSYKEGTFYLTQIALRQMHYNLYKILKDENATYNCPENSMYTKVVYKNKSYMVRGGVFDYIDNGFNLTEDNDKTTDINADDIVLELPDREVRVTIFKDEQNKNIIQFLGTTFTIRLAAIFLRKISPINNIA